MTKDYIKFVDELVSLSAETEWIEFKKNHQSPERIGEYISALANAAALHQQHEAFLIFGIEDKTHSVVGTTFNHVTTKGKGNYDLEPWLHDQLKPRHEFDIKEIEYEDKRLVVFFIKPALNGPISFLKNKYIRIGSTTKKLNDFPEKEAIIWERRVQFEQKIAKEDISIDDILKLLDFDQYYQKTEKALPKETARIVDKFIEEEFIIKRKGKLHITNLGAILLARDINNFDNLKSKAVRIITYKDINKLHAIQDMTGIRGYASGFDNMLQYINSQIPNVESIVEGSRKAIKTYPVESIREFVANALVHQDFALPGIGPTIEIYSNRIEIYNPGHPLVEPMRFMDTEPKSRNEKLTDTLRRLKVCEKRGSGVDRAVFMLELMQSPAPKIEKDGSGVKVTLYSHRKLNELTKEEKVRACYFHSQIQHIVKQEPMTNSSLCKRLGIEIKNQSIASRIIKDTLEKEWIKPFDPDNKSSRYAKYIPFYA